MDWRRRKYYKVQVFGIQPEQKLKNIKRIPGVKMHPFKPVEKQNDESVERGFYNTLISVPFWAVEHLETEFKQINAGWREIKRPEGAKEPGIQEDGKFDFYSAWHFLNNHVIFMDTELALSRFSESLCIEVVKVDPSTKEINLEDKSKNTLTNIWLECGPRMENDGAFSHDINLDCGGNTYEEAIIELAKRVKRHYNKDGTKRI